MKSSWFPQAGLGVSFPLLWHLLVLCRSSLSFFFFCICFLWYSIHHNDRKCVFSSSICLHMRMLNKWWITVIISSIIVIEYLRLYMNTSYSLCFLCPTFNLHKPFWKMLSLFYRWGNWSSEKWRDMPKAKQLLCAVLGFPPLPPLVCLERNKVSINIWNDFSTILSSVWP